MMKKSKWFNFQEILNLYPAHAPSYPHDDATPADWFTNMLEDADMEFAVYTLSQYFTDDLINEVVNALMWIVYCRHDLDYIYRVDMNWDEDYELQQVDFRKAMKEVLNVLNNTIARYIPMLQQNEYASTDPVTPVSSVTKGKTRFNDTPQEGGDYNNDPHATNVSESESEIKVDSGSLVSRLSEMFKDFRSIMLDWSNEFNKCFLEEEQL